MHVMCVGWRLRGTPLCHLVGLCFAEHRYDFTQLHSLPYVSELLSRTAASVDKAVRRIWLSNLRLVEIGQVCPPPSFAV
jgi:hypothetical protein